MNKRILSLTNILRFAVIFAALTLSACSGSAPSAQTSNVPVAVPPVASVVEVASQPGEIEFTGTVQSISDSVVQVEGMAFRVDSQTSWAQDLTVGSQVQVNAVTLPDQTHYALGVQFAAAPVVAGEVKFEFEDVVVSIADAGWQIGEQMVLVDAETVIEAGIVAGDLVEVEGVVVNGELLAREIELEDDIEITPTPMPIGQAIIELVGQLAAIDGASLQVGGLTFAITPETKIQGVLQVGDIVEVEAARAEDGSLTALEVELAELDDLTDPTAVVIGIKGVVESISETLWVIGGFQVAVNADTEIEEGLVVGDLAEVEGLLQADGTLLASEIELAELDDDDMDDEEDDDDLDDEEDDDDLDDEEDEEDDDEDEDEEDDDDDDDEDGAVQP